jgi:hypothetical protein
MSVGSSTQTPTLALPQFGDNDKPTWRGDVNDAMGKIDTAHTTLTAQVNNQQTEIVALQNFKNEAPEIWAKEYGVVFDGATDNTAAWAACIAALPNGGKIRCNSGTAVGQLVLPSDITVEGGALGLTILKAQTGLAGAVVKSKDFDTLTGTATLNPETRGSHRIGLSNLSIDGNKANAPSSEGINIYGMGWTFRNIMVDGCGVNGIHTEFGEEVDFATETTLEGSARDVRSANNGGHGWLFRGPHDSNIVGYTAFGNSGWGFRNESLTGHYNGGIGHCGQFNMFLNANGWYVGAPVASYAGGQIAGTSGTGLEMLAGVGSLVILGLLVSGFTIGVIARGSEHNLNFTVQDCATGLQVEQLGGSVVNVVGVGNTVAGINIVSEDTPNVFTGNINTTAPAVTLEGAFAYGDSVMICQGGTTAGMIFQLPESALTVTAAEIASQRNITSTNHLIAGRNTADQTIIGQDVGYNGRAALNFGDAQIYHDGVGVVAMPPNEVFKHGRGPTSARPSAAAVGTGCEYYDTTIVKPVWSDGAVWRDSTGAAV